MDTSLIFITPDRWLIVSVIFLALSFFMHRRIPLIIAGTAFIICTVSFIYPFLVKTGPLSMGMQIALFFVLLTLGLLFIHIAPASIPSPLKKGDVLTLTNPIQKGEGQEVVGEKIYTLVGPDCPKGSEVTIFSIHDTTLYVQPKKK